MMNVSLKSSIDELNEQQKAAVLQPINSFTKIVAGAGTGKTKIISKRYIKLVEELQQENIENPIERILVITFTDKAAAEMKGRIFKELQDNKISIASQEDWISTIHSFCSKILKKHSIEVGLSPNYKLADDLKQEEIYNTIIQKIEFEELDTIENIQQILDNLNLDKTITKAKNIIKMKEFGNSDAIFEEIFYVIKKIKSLGLTPKQFLQQSLKAISDFSNTVETIPFGFTDKEDYYYAWENHLKKYADISCDFSQDVIDELFSDKIILDKNNSRKKTSEDWSQASGFPENIKPITDIEIYLTKLIALIYELYQQELNKNDLIDFDDLINKTLIILDNNEAIRLYYKKHFKHIIVDEFQDTSTAQMKLILRLMSDDAPNLTIVGDRKQSIYGFRYAKMENLDVIAKIIEDKFKTKFQEIKLKTNYRSNPQVLEIVNTVTENELNLDEKLYANPNINFLQNDEAVKISNFENVKNAKSHKIKEAEFFAQEILRIKEKEQLNFKDFAILVKTHPQADIIEEELLKFSIPAIKKVNTNFFQKKVIKNVIEMFNFAQDIKNEIALVRLLKIKFSDMELYKLKDAMFSVLEEIPLEEDIKEYNFAEKLLEIYSKDKIKNLDISEENKNYIINIYETIFEIFSNKKHLSLISIFYKLIEKIKPYNNLSTTEEKLANIDLKVFEKIIADYVKSQVYTNVRSFNEYIKTIQNDRNFELPQNSTRDIDAVQILTIHASKGLEFPYVFVAHITSKSDERNGKIFFELGYFDKANFGIFINKFKGKETPKAKIYKAIYQNPRAKQEKLRLFYVALSRAEKYLDVLSFEKYTNVLPAEYVKNLKEYFPNYVKNIDTENL